MKYILQPIPKSNPYDKEQPLNPYTPINQDNQQSAFIDVLQQPTLKLYCEGCKKQITHHVHSQFESKQMCVACFANLETIPNQYAIVQKLDYSIFESAWTVYQQVLLLASLQKWGFGNWKDVQEYMEYFGAKFTQDQIETHYNTFYLSDKTFLPRFSQDLIDRKKQSQNCKSITPNQVSIVSLTTNIRQDSNNYTFEQIDDFSHQAMMQPLPRHLMSSSPQRIKGYNPNRKQFQVDFDETAQKNIANLEFRQDDLPQERQVKYKMIQEYNQRLKKRYQVHDFIVQHKLLDLEYQKQLDQNRSEYQKQAASQLKKFMRFSSLQAHNELVRRVALQKELKSIIEGMRSYRRVSNSGRLKQTFQQLKRQSIQSPSTPSRSRGRPRKIVHIDNSEKSTTSNSEFLPVNKKSKNQEELFKKLKINMGDLKHIIGQSSHKNSGEAFVYKGVEVMVVQRK